MSKKNGFSMLETITPMVRLLPPARLRAWRFGWYFSSSMAFTTRARVVLLTTLALLSTRETVAVETLARLATCSRFMAIVSMVRGLSPFWVLRSYKWAAGRRLALDRFADSAYTNPKPTLWEIRPSNLRNAGFVKGSWEFSF